MTSLVIGDPLGDMMPTFSPVLIPVLPSLNLTDDEKRLVATLQTRQWRQRYWMNLTQSYYRGEQLIVDLGIAIPPELSGLRTVVGWPRVGVDPLVYRLRCDGFRLPGATDVDQDLADVWSANRMDAEQGLLFKDALVKGRGWITLGSPETPGDAPVMCVESPLNVSALWDVRSLQPKALLHAFWLDGQRHAALMLPDQTIELGQDDLTGEWQVTNRDKHGFGRVPAVRLANEPESDRRDGVSEITPELMSITDAACRTLLGLEVAREFYSVPQKYILGASESDFVNADGTPKAAWSTYISRILAIEPDEEGNLPTVGQFKPVDPSVFTKIIDMYASQAAGILAAPPQELGLYTQGNPVSVDAYQASESRRDRYARHKQASYGSTLIAAQQLAARFMNNGELPDKYRRLECDWMPPEMLNLAVVTDALSKQVATGMVPPTSDVVLKRAGYSAVERAQLEQDRKVDAGAQVLAELASSLQAKQARTDLAVAHDIAPTTTKPTPTPPPAVPAQP